MPTDTIMIMMLLMLLPLMMMLNSAPFVRPQIRLFLLIAPKPLFQQANLFRSKQIITVSMINRMPDDDNDVAAEQQF